MAESGESRPYQPHPAPVAMSQVERQDGLTMNAISLFAGVGGIDVACERAGLKVVGAVEIDKAARKVLRRQFPHTAIYEDVTRVHSPDTCSGCDNCLPAGRIRVVTAGWPCQDLSVAGRRLGLGGKRSGLWWEVVRILAELRPDWFIGENVPGLLSACCPCPGDGSCAAAGLVCAGTPHTVGGGICPGGCMAAHGGAMGAVLGSLAELGYGFAYRVLDAQFFGVPQRRPRVILVGHLGEWTAPAEVLLEPESSAGDLASGESARSRVAATLTSGSHRAGISAPGRRQEDDVNLVVSTLQGGGNRGYRVDAEAAAGGHLVTFQKVTRPASSDHPDVWEERDVAATLSPFDLGSDTRAVELVVAHALTSEGADASEDGTGRGTPLVVGNWTGGSNQDQVIGEDGLAPTLAHSSNSHAGNHQPKVQYGATVRRLTPKECERLQGFPDDWTAPQADAPRYRQMGNAVAVPVLEWVMRRVVAVDSRLAQVPGDGPVLYEHSQGVHEVGAEAVVAEVTGDGPGVGPERIGDADVA